MKIGEYIKALREGLHLSYSNVTYLSNGDISQNYLAQLENDRIRQPSIRKLHILSNIYGIPFFDILSVAGYLSENGKSEQEIADGIVLEHPGLKDALKDLVATLPKELAPEERKGILMGFSFAAKYIKITRSTHNA